MILPSDGDLPPRRKDNDDKVPPQEPENEDWWEDDDDDDEDEVDDSDLPEGFDDDKNFVPEDKIILKSMAAPGWREDLVKDLIDCVADMREIEDPDDEYDPPEPPDLYTFFGELAALRNEMRRSGRRAGDAVEKTATAFDSVQSLLKSMSPAGKKSKTATEPWPVETCLALVALHDLFQENRPGKAAAASFEPLFKAAGLERILTEGQAFDAGIMTVAAVEPGAGASRIILRETEAGFLREGVLLRPAKVVISG